MPAKSNLATVRIASAVPALDRDFDYLIPPEMAESLQIGSLVQIPFGKSNAAKSAYVISLRTQPAMTASELKSIESILSPFPQFAEEQLAFLRALANRQGSSFSELIAHAAPKRSTLVEKRNASKPTHSDSPKSPITASNSNGQPNRTFVRLPATEKSQNTKDQSWINLFVGKAAERLVNGHSTIILVPDFRELDELDSGLEQLGLAKQSIRIVASDKLTVSYQNYLHALGDEARIVYGLRTAVLAPAHQLGLICVLDESDSAFVEQASPYWVCRDAVLTRGNSAHCDVLFASRIASAEMERFIEIGFVKRELLPVNAPAVHLNNSAQRLDETSFRLIRKALDSNKNVLVQVATLGHTNSLFCSECGELARCRTCNSALVLTLSATPTCRYCASDSRESRCACGNARWRWGRAGLDRVAEELAKSFADATLVSASGSEILTWVDSIRTIVVSTAGSEPKTNGGFEVVLFIDADAQLAGNRLRNSETAVRHWLNACAKLAPSGKAIFRISDSNFARLLSRFAIDELSHQEWQSRKESGMPPARRLASVTATDQMWLGQLFKTLSPHFECFRNQDNGKVGVLFDYQKFDALKQAISNCLRALPETKATTSASGKPRNIRAVTVKFDDVELI
jgi:primosomal protein N' (replication factor Y)